MKVTENMAATLPDSEDIDEALRLNLRAKKSSTQKTPKSKAKVSLVSAIQNKFYIALFLLKFHQKGGTAEFEIRCKEYFTIITVHGKSFVFIFNWVYF